MVFDSSESNHLTGFHCKVINSRLTGALEGHSIKHK